MDPHAATPSGDGPSPAVRPAGAGRRGTGGVLVIAITLVAAVTLGACSGAGDPELSFDPAAPCTTDGQQPGAYPELEALLPGTWANREPTSLESGRSCTAEALGTLASRGIEELRFAGATWQVNGPTGFTFAIFEAGGLDAGSVVEFYEAGSRSLRAGDQFQTSDTTVGGEPAIRLDVAGADGSSQTVVAWPGPGAPGGAGRVFALLVAGMGDDEVAGLLETFGGR